MSIIDRLKSLMGKNKASETTISEDTTRTDLLKDAIKLVKECENHEIKYNLLATIKFKYKETFIEALETFDYLDYVILLDNEENATVAILFNSDVEEVKRQEIKESAIKLYNITSVLYRNQLEERNKELLRRFALPDNDVFYTMHTGQVYASIRRR